MREEEWPHQFIDDGAPFLDANGQRCQQKMCIHCDRRYLAGRESRPNDACPGRHHAKEMKRVLG